jgi:hypothetical protein
VRPSARLALGDAGRAGSQHDRDAVTPEPVRGFLHHVGDLGDRRKHQTVVATIHRFQLRRDAGQWAGDFAHMHGTARDEIITGRQPARAGKERARHRVLADADRRGDPHSGNAKSGAAHRLVSDDWTSIS